MTLTTIHPAEADASVDVRPQPPTRTQRWATPVALGAAGVIALAAFSLHPQGNDDDQAFVASLNGHLQRWAVSHVLETLVFVALLIGSGAVFRLARNRGTAGKVTAAGAIAMAVGSIAAVFETVGHGFLAYALAERSDVSVALSTRIQLDFARLPWVAPMFIGTVVVQVGSLLIALGLIGSRAVPRGPRCCCC